MRDRKRLHGVAQLFLGMFLRAVLNEPSLQESQLGPL